MRVAEQLVDGGAGGADGFTITDKLAEEMWVKLKKNKVKANQRAGVDSAGLFYGSRFYLIGEDGERKYQDSASWNPNWKEGDDVTDQLKP